MSTSDPPISHQTVRLARGKHAGPDGGACVMELVSMLAGEPFTDRPRTTCPVIASFLRTYNDAVDDNRRQDLYALASTVVDTRATSGVERARASRCVEVLEELEGRGHTWHQLFRRRRRLTPSRAGLERAGARLARELHHRGEAGHERAMAVVAELAAMCASGTRPPSAIASDPRELTRT